MDTPQSNRRVRARRHIAICADESGSDDDESPRTALCKAPLPCDSSRSYNEGGLPSLENSQASLNKRLASMAGLDEEKGPTDWGFLLKRAIPVESSARETPEHENKLEIGIAGDGDRCTNLSTEPPASFQAVMEVLVAKEPPPAFDSDGVHWVNSKISKGSDLIDGQRWIADFQRRLAEAKSHPENAAMRDMALRNRVLKDMSNVSPPGRKVVLPSGQEIIFWFNVGAAGPPRTRVYVTDAHCPHQGVCLLGAELMEIEDLATGPRALTRCPRHNKRFDLCTGESQGNAEHLRHYPCRFEHGCWYVGVGPSPEACDDSAKPKEGDEKETHTCAKVITKPVSKKARTSLRVMPDGGA